MQIHAHNRIAYEKVKSYFSDCTYPRCCVIHPTGTGKSYIALQLIQDNRDKSILYITSYTVNLALFKQSVEKNIGEVEALDCYTYPGLMAESKNEGWESPHYDYIILDEFHRAGAELWQTAVEAVLRANPSAYVLGLTATPIRYLDNERNMAAELFNSNIVSEITLHEALMSGLLPMPNYTTCVYSFEDDIRNAERALLHLKKKSRVEDGRLILEKAKRLLQNVSGLDEVFKEKLIYPKGRYVVFCKNVEHLYSMMLESRDWFRWLETEPHQYMLYSQMETDDDQMEAFVSDGTETLKLLFCVDMLNEGVHFKGINGVIMLRPTESLNIYFQQLGRALTVGDDETETRTPPQIIDVVNNAASLAPVQSFWTELIEQRRANGEADPGYFDVWWRDVEIQNVLADFRRHMAFLTWDEYYEICADYYREHGNLDIPFKYYVSYTDVGSWLFRQRKRKDELSEDQVARLEKIGIRWNPALDRWEEYYSEAKCYYEAYGNLNIQYSHDQRMFTWLDRQRENKGLLSEDQIAKLDAIGMEWYRKKTKRKTVKPRKWEEVYELCKQYYEENGDLEIPKHYRMDGLDINAWVVKQRLRYKLTEGASNGNEGRSSNKTITALTEDQIARLDAIGMEWNPEAKAWEEGYALAEEFYRRYGHLKTSFGAVKAFEEELGDNASGKNLNYWVSAQRDKYAAGKLSQEYIDRLNAIGMVWDVRKANWDAFYECAVAYYNEYGNLDMPMTTEYHGIKLGAWLTNIRMAESGRVGGYAKLTAEQKEKLNAMGMLWSPSTDKWDRNFQVIKEYYDEHGSLDGIKEKNPDAAEWLQRQRNRYIATERAKEAGRNRRSPMTEEQKKLLDSVGMEWLIQADKNLVEWYEKLELAKKYIAETGSIVMPRRTVYQGVRLGDWVIRQRDKLYGKGKGTLTEEQIELLASIGIVKE